MVVATIVAFGTVGRPIGRVPVAAEPVAAEPVAAEPVAGRTTSRRTLSAENQWPREQLAAYISTYKTGTCPVA